MTEESARAMTTIDEAMALLQLWLHVDNPEDYEDAKQKTMQFTFDRLVDSSAPAQHQEVGLVCGTGEHHTFVGQLHPDFKMPTDKFKVYAAPPSAAALIAEKDAEIERLKAEQDSWFKAEAGFYGIPQPNGRNSAVLALKERASTAERALAQIKEAKAFATLYEMRAREGGGGQWLTLNPLDPNGVAQRAIPVYAAPQPPAGNRDAVVVSPLDPSKPMVIENCYFDNDAIPREIHDRLLLEARREALRVAYKDLWNTEPADRMERLKQLASES
jgi:hypothetical protein